MCSAGGVTATIMAKLHDGLTPRVNPANPDGPLLLDLRLPDFSDATPLSTPVPSDEDEDADAVTAAEAEGEGELSAGIIAEAPAPGAHGFEVPGRVLVGAGGKAPGAGGGGNSKLNTRKRRRSGEAALLSASAGASGSSSSGLALVLSGAKARRERTRVRRIAQDAHILSPLETAPRAVIEKHLVRLRAGVIFRYLMPLLQRFLNHALNRGLFNDPVNLEVYPDYSKVIARPMDLGMVKQKLQALLYEDELEFSEEVRTVFQNAMRYNPEGNQVHQNAARLLQEFEQDFGRVLQRAKARLAAQQSHGHDCELCRGNECPLCGEKCLKFDPPMLPCSGTCALNIRRGAIYYMTPDGCRFWCQRCFNALPQIVPPHLVTKGAKDQKEQLKRDLRRLTHSAEDTGEPWVQCDCCRLWMHQACALFSLRKNLLASAPMAVRFKCAICRLAELNAVEAEAGGSATTGQPGAAGAIAATVGSGTRAANGNGQPPLPPAASPPLRRQHVAAPPAYDNPDAQTSAAAAAAALGRSTPRSRSLGVSTVEGFDAPGDLSATADGGGARDAKNSRHAQLRAHPGPRDCRAETLPKTRMGSYVLRPCATAPIPARQPRVLQPSILQPKGGIDSLLSVDSLFSPPLFLCLEFWVDFLLISIDSTWAGSLRSACTQSCAPWTRNPSARPSQYAVCARTTWPSPCTRSCANTSRREMAPPTQWRCGIARKPSASSRSSTDLTCASSPCTCG